MVPDYWCRCWIAGVGAERGGDRQRAWAGSAAAETSIHHPLINSGQQPRTPYITGPLLVLLDGCRTSGTSHPTKALQPLFVLLPKYGPLPSPLFSLSNRILTPPCSLSKIAFDKYPAIFHRHQRAGSFPQH